jgi:hypothetical protein
MDAALRRRMFRPASTHPAIYGAPTEGSGLFGATVDRSLLLISGFEMMKFSPMPSAHFANDRPVDYFILVDPRADGPVIGSFNEQPIPASVKDAFGRRYSYVGIATKLRDGRLDAKTLSPGEWFVQPGLVYRMEASEPSLLNRLLKRNDASHDKHASQ